MFVHASCVVVRCWWCRWVIGFLDNDFFFFEADEGIRCLVRSRGVGDVYKRESQKWSPGGLRAAHALASQPLAPRGARLPRRITRLLARRISHY